VLDHADARDRVERLAGQLAVVGEADLDALVEPGLRHASACELGLRGRQRRAHHLHAVARGGVDREAAPAAAHVEHAHAAAQAELLADELELRLLGGLERVGAAREERAAVGHGGVEEEREELVRDVVVVANRAGVPRQAVAPPARPELRRGRPRWAHRPARAAASASRARAARSSGGGRQLPSRRTAASRSSTSSSPDT
jgi:hypothetical protein